MAVLGETINLNDWLNAFAENSLFGEFEKTDEFAEIIDDVLEKLEETLTEEFIEDLRQSGSVSESAIEALRDLYERLLQDEFELDYRLMSPKSEDRFWVFNVKKDEFEVTQISVYQIVEGVDFQVLGFAGGDLDELGQNLPDKFENYEEVRVVQYDVQDDQVMSMEEWEELMQFDQQTEFIGDAEYGRHQMRRQCEHIMKFRADSHAARKCHAIYGEYRSMIGHMIAWPIVFFVVVATILLTKALCRRRSPTQPDQKTAAATDEKPPEYNFVIQFPPDYNNLSEKPAERNQ